MIKISEKLKDVKINDTKMILQIHDELIFEAPSKDTAKISKIIKKEMTSVQNSELHSFSIPLSVDINVGDNWGITLDLY